jgi:ABC-type transport system involved in multi-copper enzyme maturation permease subunit
LPVAIIILLALFAIAFFALLGDYHRRLDDYAILSSAESRLLSVQQPSALNIVAMGLGDQLTSPYQLDEFGRISGGATEKTTNRFYRKFEPPDVLYIFRVIVTLMALFFTYDAIVGEKEQGTLAVCLSNAVSRRAFILGKMVGNFLSLAVPCAALCLLGIVVLALVPTINLTATDIFRLGIFVVLSLLLAALFVGLGTWVSAACASAGRSLVVLIGVWVLMTYCIPNIAASVAHQVAPISSSTEIDRKLDAIWIKGVFDLLHQSEDGSFTHQQRSESNRRILDEFRRIESDYFSRVENQNRVWAAASRLSPVAAYNDAATTILASGIPSVRSFKAALMQRRDAIFSAGEKPEPGWVFTGLTIEESLTAALADIAEIVALIGLVTLGAVFQFNRAAIN